MCRLFFYRGLTGWQGGSGAQYLIETAAGMCLHTAIVGISFDVSFAINEFLLYCNMILLLYHF